MGCTSSIDLSEEQDTVRRWETEHMITQSVWMGRANMCDDVLDYLEIEVISKNGEELKGKRVVNIAESVSTTSTRFGFEIEKNKDRSKKDDPLHVVTFYWSDPKGLTLRGTFLNENSKKIHGHATYIDPETKKTYSGDFKIARVAAPSIHITPSRDSRTDSKHNLLESSSQMALRKYNKEENMRLSKIEDKVIRLANSASTLESGSVSPRRNPEFSTSQHSSRRSVSRKKRRVKPEIDMDNGATTPI